MRGPVCPLSATFHIHQGQVSPASESQLGSSLSSPPPAKGVPQPAKAPVHAGSVPTPSHPPHGCSEPGPGLCASPGSEVHPSPSFSFSTDDDNDVEVEALEGDSELNLVTEVWVEPQHGRVGPGPESWRHLQDLMYSEIPQAVSDHPGAPSPLQLCIWWAPWPSSPLSRTF